MGLRHRSFFVLLASIAVACAPSEPIDGESGGSPATGGAGAGPSDGGGVVSASGGGGAGDGAGAVGGEGTGGMEPVWVDTLTSNRDRLLRDYYEYLEANASQPHSNGLSSDNVANVCDVWSQLNPSAREVFLTITARLQGSRLGTDDSSMLWHVERLYRIAGGEGETQLDPGSCGGAEFNRLIMGSDAVLHAAQLAAYDHGDDIQPNGKYEISDAPPGGSYWRETNDLGGTHEPFDISNETDEGAPRGQTQYFADPTSALANSPLGRMDVPSLVDPYAMEIDQDYNCPHDSNPLCSYTTYGPFCFLDRAKLGTQIYSESYGDYEPSWSPTGCP